MIQARLLDGPHDGFIDHVMREAGMRPAELVVVAWCTWCKRDHLHAADDRPEVDDVYLLEPDDLEDPEQLIYVWVDVDQVDDLLELATTARA